MTATTPRAGAAPVAERRTSAPSPEVAAGRRAWVLVALATVASLVARLVLARWVDGPFMFQDEGGYVGVARAVAGQDPDLYGPTYHPLWGLLLAPAAALLDPAGQQTAAQVLNAVAAAATIPVLHLLGRRVCGLPPTTAALAAIAGGLTAASFVQATMLLPEVLLALLVATTVVLVHEALARATTASAVAAGVAAGAAYGAHPRALVLVLAVLVVAAVAWRSAAAPARALATLAGSTLATAAAFQLLHAWATARLYPSGTQPSLAGSPLGAVTEPVGSLVITLGQSWYLVAASLGLAALGLVAAGRLAWTERRRAAGLTGLLVVLGALGSLALGTGGSYEVGLADDVHRADLPLYGRYLEQWLPVLVVWAPALPRRGRRIAVAATAAGVACVALLLHAVYDPETWRQPVAWHNVSTLRLPYDVIGKDHLVRTGLVVAGLALLAALPRRAGDRRWLLPLAAVAVVNVVAGHWLVRDWAGPSGAHWAERQVIAPALVASGEPAWVDLDEYHEVAWAYHAQFWHPDLEVRYFEGAVPPEATHLVARTEAAPAPGATMVLTEPHGDYALWTRPPG
ncbi:MAG: hypothetical protein ACLGIC_09960 [Acidimicrobiia bacterium]